MNIFRAISNLLRFDRTNWKALTLCFFAAAIFWIFSAFNKDYSTNLTFPLKFEYDPARFVPVEPLPHSLILNVSGNGWELFRKSLGVKVPVISMLLERPTETRKIVASSLAPMVASQVGTLQLNYIVNDTLRLKIEPRAARKIRLVADLQGVSFKREFGRTGPIAILPDAVELEGPKSVLEGLPDSLVLRVAGSRISENFRESMEVSISNGEAINRNPPVVDVTFDVGPVEEISNNVRLKLPKMPWGIEADRDSVICVFVVPQKDHNRFISDAALIQAAFGLPEMKKGETKRFLPSVTGVPAYARIIHIDSVSVKRY